MNLMHEYSQLIFSKDVLEKEAGEIRLKYLRLFGQLVKENMELRYEILLRKNAIALLAQARNRKQPLSLNELRRMLDEKTASFYKGVSDTAKVIALAGEAKPITKAEHVKIHKTYRALAKQIHPDLHPDLWQTAGLSDLWEKAKTAYETNNLEVLEEAQIQILNLIEEKNLETSMPELDNLPQRIEKVQKQIDTILTTEPYTLEIYLSSPQKDEHLHQLEEQVKESQTYIRSLENTLENVFQLDWGQLWLLS